MSALSYILEFDTETHLRFVSTLQGIKNDFERKACQPFDWAQEVQDRG